MMEIQTRSK